MTTCAAMRIAGVWAFETRTMDMMGIGMTMTRIVTFEGEHAADSHVLLPNKAAGMKATFAYRNSEPE